jgi:transposase
LVSAVEVVITRRRRWSAAEKAALLAEVEAEGGKVAVVARRHGVSESLLYNWRSACKAGAAAVRGAEEVAFIPVGMVGGPGHEVAAVAAPRGPQQRMPLAQASDGKAGAIEIALPNGARICVDAFVNEKALARVLRAMKLST